MAALSNLITKSKLTVDECATVIDAVNNVDPTISMFDLINWTTGGVKGLDYDFKGVQKMSRAVETIVGPEVYLLTNFVGIKKALYEKIGLAA